jgi:hypothetical protein
LVAVSVDGAAPMRDNAVVDASPTTTPTIAAISTSSRHAPMHIEAQLIDQETTSRGHRLVVADPEQWCCDPE